MELNLTGESIAAHLKILSPAIAGELIIVLWHPY